MQSFKVVLCGSYEGDIVTKDKLEYQFFKEKYKHQIKRNSNLKSKLNVHSDILLEKYSKRQVSENSGYCRGEKKINANFG